MLSGHLEAIKERQVSFGIKWYEKLFGIINPKFALVGVSDVLMQNLR